MKKTLEVWLKSKQLKSFMRSAKPNVITHTYLDLPPSSPHFFSVFILHWICHSALKYSCRLWKMNASAESSRSWKEREVSRYDRYSLMMKVTESFESSLASGNVNGVRAAEHKCMCMAAHLHGVKCKSWATPGHNFN